MWQEVWPGNYQFDPTLWWLAGFLVLWSAVVVSAWMAYLLGFGPLSRGPTQSFWSATVDLLKMEATASFAAFLFATLICFMAFVLWMVVVGAGVVIGLMPEGTDPLAPGFMMLLAGVQAATQALALGVVWKAGV